VSVVGLDLSLSGTGIATDEGATTVRTRLVGMARLAYLRDAVASVAGGAGLVVVEGYSFNSRVGGEHLGELGGVVRLALHEMGAPFADVAPALVKKYATARGNAPKEQVLIAAIHAGADVADNNQADAWWLRALGMHHAGSPVVPATKARDDVTGRVEWPMLARRAG
jgi:Holliday junction resolvasome RuvABC endonuclease subunit